MKSYIDAVIGVGAALADHVDLRCLVAELSRIDTCLHLELLDAVKGGQPDVGIEIGIGIVHAVQRVVVEHDALAADRDRLAGAIAAEAAARLARCRMTACWRWTKEQPGPDSFCRSAAAR